MDLPDNTDPPKTSKSTFYTPTTTPTKAAAAAKGKCFVTMPKIEIPRLNLSQTQPINQGIEPSNIKKMVGLMQYKTMEKCDEDEKKHIRNPPAVSVVVEPAASAAAVAAAAAAVAVEPQLNTKNIDINGFLEFLKVFQEFKKTDELPLPPLKSLPLELKNPANVSLKALEELEELEKIKKDKTSPYANGKEMEIYEEDGTTFQQITFTPPGPGSEQVTLLFPHSQPRVAIIRPQTPEEFAQSYIHMLGVKKDIQEQQYDMELRNKLSSLVFKCTMSLLLGYLYNYFKTHLLNFATTTPMSELQADDIGMIIIQSEIDAGLYSDTDYGALFARLTFIKEHLMKEGVASPEFKSLFGIPHSPGSNATDNSSFQPADHYETIMEMVCRIGLQPPDVPAGTELNWSYASILHSVCSNICKILVSYNIFSEQILEKAEPIVNSVLVLLDTGNTSTIFTRMKAIIILGVAYNSYGWLFAIVAPFAVPAAISVANWGICFLARLPFKAIMYAGKGVYGVGKWLVTNDNSSESGYQNPKDSDGSLICVGHTKTKTGDLVPYLVSMNDINRLAYELRNSKLPTPSLASWLCDARGVADLMMQQHSVEEKGGVSLNMSNFFRETNPVANLLKCIDTEILMLSDNEIGEIKTIPEILFSVFFKTICRNKGEIEGAEKIDNSFLIGPVIRIWAELLHEAISGLRSGVLGTVKSVITELILNDGVMEIASPRADSDVSSICSSLTNSPTGSDDSNGDSNGDDSSGDSSGDNSPNNIERNDSNTSTNSFSSTSSSASFKSFNNSIDEITIESNKSNESNESNKSNTISINLKLNKPPIKWEDISTILQPIMNNKENIVNKKWESLFDSNTTDNKDNKDRCKIPTGTVFACVTSVSQPVETCNSIIEIDLSNEKMASVSKKMASVSEKMESVNGQNISDDIREAKRLVDTATESVNEIIAKMKEPQSDLLVFLLLDWVIDLSLIFFPQTSRKGGYKRKRNVPILAEIKHQINKKGFIKQKLKRKSKRYGPKKGTKKWRKRYGSRRGTKKVYRKRHNTHKKRK
jgi:hypothetical protein